MEGLVSGGQGYRRILSVLLPAGALGMSILLGSTGAKADREIPTGPQSNLAPPARVAERLAAIRDAVSDIAGVEGKAAPAPEGIERLAWHNWKNGGGWPLWTDWRNKWKDWNNNWHNGWNNWGNNWKNWGNGWNNW
jgi:rSAM-associated Gly-rich repeat protein